MPAEIGPIIFYDQKFAGTDLPEGEDVREEARLRAAITGVYELQFRQQPHYALSGAFLYDDTKPQQHGQQKQFEVSEDITEDERNLTIQTTADVINLDSLEIVPLDWRGDSLEFTSLESSKSQRKISYRKDAPVESLRLKLSGLNVFEVESIKTVLWANGSDYSTGRLAAFIRHSEAIRIDKLDNSEGGPRTIEDHLNTLVHLLFEKAPDRTFDFECNYRYYPVAGGPYVLVPVLFKRSLDLQTAGVLFSDLMPVLRNWYQTSLPPKGVFDFSVKVYGVRPGESAPIIHLEGLLLPIESIAGWSDPG